MDNISELRKERDTVSRLIVDGYFRVDTAVMIFR
jgi:hypothetical protein